MKAAVLAGGEGTRLRPVTLRVPKAFLPVAQLPILAHQVERLRRAGIEEIAACVRPSPGTDWEAFREALPGGVSVEPFWEESPLGTGGALRALLPWLGGERLFAVNGDDLTDSDPRVLVRAHEDSGAAATVGLRTIEEPGALSGEDADPSVYGNVVMDPEGRVREFLEKPPAAKASGLINAGQYVLEAGALEDMPADRPFSIEREGFPGLLARGVAISGAVLEGYHRPVNTPAQYLMVHRDLYDGRWKPSWIERGQGHNRIGKSCRIFPGASLRDNVTLGDGCEVGQGALLEDVVVFPGARIGPEARVTRSVLGAGVRIGHHARVDRSVLAGGSFVPPWTSLGSLEPGRRGTRPT